MMQNSHTTQPTVHLINRFQHVAGSEHRAIGLARILADHADVRLWATAAPNPRLEGPVPIRQIDVRRGAFPRTGTFVFVGVYYWLGRWIRLTRPSRRIIIYNTPDPDLFAAFEPKTARTLQRRAPSCEVVLATELLQPIFGQQGVVQESPIDIHAFRPRVGATVQGAARFRVGRLSREHPEKFHEHDGALYRGLASQGYDVRLMGAARLGLEGVPGIEVIDACSEPAPTFLQSIDCFVYRTRSDWLDSFGRVVFEAMACGLPVILGRRGGYARYINDGENGFLFDTNDEAIERVRRVRDDPDLRARLGHNARLTAERLYSKNYERDIVAFYTRGAAAREPRLEAARAPEISNPIPLGHGL
jgi:glycosyltransferase involved in cell wall biosynthesis